MSEPETCVNAASSVSNIKAKLCLCSVGSLGVHCCAIGDYKSKAPPCRHYEEKQLLDFDLGLQPAAILPRRRKKKALVGGNDIFAFTYFLLKSNSCCESLLNRERGREKMHWSKLLKYKLMANFSTKKNCHE